MSLPVSDNYLRLIPADPSFVPDAGAQARAHNLLRTRLAGADAITIRVTPDIQFVDPGSNLEGIFCPACGARLDRWWGDAIDRASASSFQELRVQVPCCGAVCSLNDLRYEWPAGFARFVLEAMNPGVPDLPAGDLALLEDILGCRLRRLWARY